MQRTFEFKEKNEKTVKEDVIIDVRDNYVEYHMNDEDKEIWVIEDFNRVCLAKIVLPFCIVICCRLIHRAMKLALRFELSSIYHSKIFEN